MATAWSVPVSIEIGLLHYPSIKLGDYRAFRRQLLLSITRFTKASKLAVHLGSCQPILPFGDRKSKTKQQQVPGTVIHGEGQVSVTCVRRLRLSSISSGHLIFDFALPSYLSHPITRQARVNARCAPLPVRTWGEARKTGGHKKR